jgi:hypothetical protein
MSELKGLYLTMDQAAYITPITQGALFDFPVRDLSDLYVHEGN